MSHHQQASSNPHNDAVRAMQTILRTTDQHEIEDNIQLLLDLVLEKRWESDQALRYLGTLLRQQSSHHRVTQEIASRLFYQTRDDIGAQFDELQRKLDELQNQYAVVQVEAQRRQKFIAMLALEDDIVHLQSQLIRQQQDAALRQQEVMALEEQAGSVWERIMAREA